MEQILPALIYQGAPKIKWDTAEKRDKGDTAAKVDDGNEGQDGLSAYQIAVKHGSCRQYDKGWTHNRTSCWDCGGSTFYPVSDLASQMVGRNTKSVSYTAYNTETACNADFPFALSTEPQSG
jgi:hypothetical protein